MILCPPLLDRPQGINFVDTAEMYPVPTRAETQGATDRVIGEWLRKRAKAEGPSFRSRLVLATKARDARHEPPAVKRGRRLAASGHKYLNPPTG